MSWTTILVIAGGTFAFKATGLFGLGRFADSPTLRALGGLLPAALLSALIVVQTVSIETDLVLDARSAGVVAGGIAAFRSAPFWLVAIIAAAVTATVRAV